MEPMLWVSLVVGVGGFTVACVIVWRARKPVRGDDVDLTHWSRGQ